MVASTIPDQHGQNVGCQRGRQLLEEEIGDARFEPRRDQALGLAGLSARRREHIDISVLRLPYRPRPRTFACPNASQRTLLAEPRFVFVKDLETAIGMLCLNSCELLAKLFLNSSCASGSP